MMIKQQIDTDLKAAMLSGDKTLTTTLRGLKSVILYAEVAAGKRDEGLDDAAITDLLAKEAKKRQESADLYQRGGSQDRVKAELAEKKIIERYLPDQLSDEELVALVDQAITEVGANGPQAIGQVIGKVKQASKGQADGARIARLVKERLGSNQ
jgi:uncharacterized protein YqeY